MEAVAFDPVEGKLKFTTKTIPQKQSDDEVLVRVILAGICGTDIYASQKEFPCGSSEVVLGHEFCGLAEVVGSNVTHIKPGDRVVVDSNRGSRDCGLCTSSKYDLCDALVVDETIGVFRDGGWAEFCLVPGFQTYKIPDGITFEQALLAEPLACMAHGWIKIGSFGLEKSFLVQAPGIIGSLWAAALHFQGYKKVTVSEPNESRRKISKKLGVPYKFVDPSELKNFQADVIIDYSGSSRALEKAMDLLSPKGKLYIFGSTPSNLKMSVSPYEINKKELTIEGSVINPITFPEAFVLIKALGPKYLDFDRLGIKVFALRNFKDALDSFKKGKIVKGVFDLTK